MALQTTTSGPCSSQPTTAITTPSNIVKSVEGCDYAPIDPALLLVKLIGFTLQTGTLFSNHIIVL